LDPVAEVPADGALDVAGGLVDAVVRVVAAQARRLESRVGLVEVAGGVGEEVAERGAGRAGPVVEGHAPLLEGERGAEAGEGLGDRAPGADPLDVAAPLPLPLGAEHDRGGLEAELVQQSEGAHRPVPPPAKRSRIASVIPGQIRIWSGPKRRSPRKAAARPASGSTQRKEPDCPKWPKARGEECAPVQCGSLCPRISTPRPQSFGVWRP